MFEEGVVDEKTFHFRNYLNVIRKRRWMIIGAVFLAVLIGGVYSYWRTPLYKATARILIEKETPNVVSFQEVVEMDTSDYTFLETQRMLLKSGCKYM